MVAVPPACVAAFAFLLFYLHAVDVAGAHKNVAHRLVLADVHVTAQMITPQKIVQLTIFDSSLDDIGLL